MGALLGFVFGLCLVGAFPAWLVVYFRNGFHTVKAEHGVDWREFMLAVPGFWLANVVFWPIGLVNWLRGGRPARSLAVISVDGRPARQVLSPAAFDIRGGVARSRSAA
jgi:hypothetical protein